MMTFRDWINYEVNPKDIWSNAVDPTGNDRDNMLIPLGLSFQPENYNILTNHSEVNTKLLFYSFRSTTDSSRRRFKGSMINGYNNNINRTTIKEELDKRYIMTKLNANDYYNEIGKYKFNISPEGNGIDCYRHYETWISKGIPIIEYNSFIQKKYKNLPILWTKDYSEINDTYLNNMYEKFLDNEYDFRRLLLTHYKPNIQQKIINVSKYNHIFKPNNGINKGNGFWNYHDYF